MTLFHTHTWEVTSSAFTAASAYPFGDINGSSGAMLDKCLAEISRCRTGETHIYLKCATCGDIGSRTVPGKWPGEPKR